jgi:hypothetical protein
MPNPNRFQADQQMLKIPRRVYARVTAIKGALQSREGRQVTYGETLDRMAELWERAAATVEADHD